MSAAEERLAGPEPLSPEREAEIREWVEAMGKQKDIRYYGSWQQHGELLGEIDRLRARVAVLEAERRSTNEVLDDAVQALRERQTEREALVERMRAGQRWKRGRNPELVSENFVSQSELRSIFGIPLVAPWGEPGYDPCHPCGCPKRFDRHADGCPATAAEADGVTRRIAPTQALREDPHDSPLHHDYRVPHDLPETGDAS